MKRYSSSVGLIVVVVCSICLSDSAFGQVFSNGFRRSTGAASARASGMGILRSNNGQNDDSYGNAPQNGTELLQRFSTSASGSRSVSFTKNGRQISIAENGAGITVSVDGNTVRAKDVAELKKTVPGCIPFV